MLAFCKNDFANVDIDSQGTLVNKQDQPPPLLQEAIADLLNTALIKQEDRVIWVHRIVQEAMNYHSMQDLQDYFDSASALVFEAFPEQPDGEYSTKEERTACLSYIPHGAHLSMKFAEHCNAGIRLRGYETPSTPQSTCLLVDIPLVLPNFSRCCTIVLGTST